MANTIEVTPDVQFVGSDGKLTRDGFNILKSLIASVEELSEEETDGDNGSGPTPDIDLKEIDAVVKSLQNFMGPGLRAILDEIQRNALRTADQDFANFTDKSQIRTELAVQYRNTKAEYTNAITVAVGPDSALAQRIEAMQVEIGTKASASAVDALTVRVDQQGDDIAINATAITQLNAQLGDKADASAVTALSATVTQLGNDVTAQAEYITSLSAAENGADPSTANLRMSVVSGPAGYARIGWETRVGGAGAWRGAAVYLDTPNNPALPTNFVALADRFVFTDGINNVTPIVFSGGVAYLNGVKANWADITNVTINGSLIINGTIDAPQLAFGAVTGVDGFVGNTTRTSSGTSVIKDIVVDTLAGGFISLVGTLGVTKQATGSGLDQVTSQIRVINLTTSQVVFSRTILVSGGTQNNSDPLDVTIIIDTPSATPQTYRCEFVLTKVGGNFTYSGSFSNAEGAQFKMLWWKR